MSTFKATSNNKRWTKADDRLLKALIKQGQNGSDIAAQMGRTRSSIFGRKQVLGIKTRINRSPKNSGIPFAIGKAKKRKTTQASTPVETTQVKSDKKVKNQKKSEPSTANTSIVLKGKMSNKNLKKIFKLAKKNNLPVTINLG